MIIYFTPGGRLGNQIFQYAMAESVGRPDEAFLFGLMEQFLAAFPQKRRVINVRRGIFLKLLERTLLPFIRIAFVSTGIFSSVIESEGSVVRRRGLFGRVTWMEGYFQDPDLATIPFVAKLRVPQSAEEEAARFLREKIGDETDWAFAHVRRTDYLTHEVLSVADPSLPIAFYDDALGVLGLRKAVSKVVVVGDDVAFLSAGLRGLGWQTIESDLNPSADFALMSAALKGVVSNSTFAWWAARSSRASIAAPKYWLGWKSQRWYPMNIEKSPFDWLEVHP